MSRTLPLRPLATSLMILCAALGAGCRSKPAPLPPPDEVVPGATLSILQPFEIPAGKAGIYFQNQAPHDRRGLNEVDPYCRYVPKTPAQGVSVVALGVYTVVAKEYVEEQEGLGNEFTSGVRYTLRGPIPNSDASLTCIVPDAADVGRFPTPAEISGALGAYFKLKLAR